MSTRLKQLFDAEGQSPWLDNLNRSYITSGHMHAVLDDGIRGLTSNPSIFQKAIQGSSDYDNQFSELIAGGLSVIDCYWEMVATDIRGALDIFRPLYDASNGLDGYVSVEVDPMLANDTEGTMSAARSLHEVINRPNVMIKIPATVEGLPVIRKMISEGKNVNVTLIFSLERYADVIEAYVSGIEELAQISPHRLKDVFSVASFFISRVDVETDRRLTAIGSDAANSLVGRSAIAQAQLAYQQFESVFHSDRWNRLQAMGANMQRPLWASTSTKNPDLPDTLYVDRLIGRHSVNTLPDATMLAFMDHGTVQQSIQTNIQDAQQVWSLLEEVGVEMTSVAKVLEREGVAAFQTSFQELLIALEEKKAKL
jgi:transaldolase